ncbi:MAG TPA: DNA recombination protein RmuC [Candidatus Poseidoniales archaeon]|nr:DNA recombination protein RmuC [Candidatus Poseidoniales archaeon]
MAVDVAYVLDILTFLVILAIGIRILTSGKNESNIDPQQYITSGQQVSETYTQMAIDYQGMTAVLGELNTTLEGARTENLNIQKFGRALSSVLTRPVIRGGVGEKLLEDMCRQYLPDRQWEKQVVTDSDAPSQQGGVDVLIHYTNVDLPVDSKFPFEAYQRYINLAESTMDGMNEAEIDNHKNAIKKQFKKFQKSILVKVDEIQDHINPPDTTDFAMMFIPTEAMYYSVVSEKNAINDQNLVSRKKGGKVVDSMLLDVMLEKKVIPVSPSIFYAYLEVINIGLRNIAILDNLDELRRRVELFKQKKGTYAAAHNKVGENLEKALNEWKTEDDRFKELETNADKVISALDTVSVEESVGAEEALDS